MLLTYSLNTKSSFEENRLLWFVWFEARLLPSPFWTVNSPVSDGRRLLLYLVEKVSKSRDRERVSLAKDSIPVATSWVLVRLLRRPMNPVWIWPLRKKLAVPSKCVGIYRPSALSNYHLWWYAEKAKRCYTTYESTHVAVDSNHFL